MLASQIMALANSYPEGALLSAKGLLHLGARAGIDQALHRLAKSGELIRISRGRYVLPVSSRFGQLAPEPQVVIAAFEAETSEAIMPTGIAAANALGLTTQMPMHESYITAGPRRQLRFGKQVVQIQHAPRWQTLLPHRQAGSVIRALAWLGEAFAGRKLRELQLPQEEWRALLQVTPRLPAWMAKAITEVGHA